MTVPNSERQRGNPIRQKQQEKNGDRLMQNATYVGPKRRPPSSPGAPFFSFPLSFFSSRSSRSGLPAGDHHIEPNSTGRIFPRRWIVRARPGGL
jgi:hypothetical protein